MRSGGTFVSIPTLTDDGDIPAAAAAGAARGVKRVFSTMTDIGCAATLRKIAKLVVDGAVVLPPLREYPLRAAAEAHAQVQGGHTRGKLVLRVQDLC